MELAEPFGFSKGCRLMKTNGRAWSKQHEYGNFLFDLEADPWQAAALDDAGQEERMKGLLRGLMQECEAPEDQYERLGI